MAAFTPTPINHLQHERFHKERGYQLWDLSLSLSGNIAVSGCHKDKRTFIDLFTDYNSDSKNKLKIFYCEEFKNYSEYSNRRASFLGNDVSKLYSTIGDRLEIIDTKNKSGVLSFCRLNSSITCLAVREGEIFVSSFKSRTVRVFKNDLKETRKIILKDLKDGDWPQDLQVIKDTIFVCTTNPYSKALSISESDGSVITEYTTTTAKYKHACSIVGSQKLGLVAVLWGVSKFGENRIIVYSLHENKSLLVFDVDSDVLRIRISDKDRMIITGSRNTGEIKMYALNEMSQIYVVANINDLTEPWSISATVKTEQLFSFEAMKRTLTFMVTPDECLELRQYFGVTEEEMSRGKVDAGEEKTIKMMNCLFTVIEQKGHLDPYNINNLKDAMSSLGDEIRVSNLQRPIEGYLLHGLLKVYNKDLMAEMIARQKTWEDEKLQLGTELETSKIKLKQHEKTLEDLHGKLADVKKQSEEHENNLEEDLKIAEGNIEVLKRQRAESIAKFEALTVELELTKSQSTEEKKTLEEELRQTKQTLDITEMKSNKTIETLTSELAKTTKTIEKLTDELAQTRSEFTAKIRTLAAEPKQTKHELNSSFQEKESNKNPTSLSPCGKPAKSGIDVSEQRSEDVKKFEENKRKKMTYLIQDLSSKIGTEWRDLGRNLGLTDEDLDHIKADIDNCQERNNQILRKWTQKNGSDATFTILIAALQKVERRDLAEYVEKFEGTLK